MYTGGGIGSIEKGFIENVTVKNLNLSLTSVSNFYVGGMIGRAENVAIVANGMPSYASVDLTILSRGDEVNEITAYIGGYVGEMINRSLEGVYATGSIYVDKLIIGTVVPSMGVDILYVGGVAGSLKSLYAKNVYYQNTNELSINLPTTNNTIKVGGFVGYAERVYLENTHAIANIFVSEKNG